MIHDSLKLSFMWTSSHATQQNQMFLQRQINKELLIKELLKCV